MIIIGILALQGGFERHENMLTKMGISSIYVKYSKDLMKCSGLIIPGGESTSLSKLINKNNLYYEILKFGKNKPIFGTCAGLILLSNINQNHIKSFNFLDIDVERNGWGRQIDSFESNIILNGLEEIFFNAIFIRAPKIKKLNNKKISILSMYKEEPVLIRYKNFLGATFHPELTDNDSIHRYFINMINES